ncbi:MAG: UDP-N-acetylmuramate dehydrogenase [Minisyncoccota bacterium]
MKVEENVPLAPFTTFRIGGPAQVFIEAGSEEEILTTLALAREGGLPLYVLGAGSNMLVPDEGVAGVVLRLALREISFETAGDDELLVAGAGTPWEEVVAAAGERSIFGIENLAGIPGTVGGAAVQNIGAYGAELSEVFEYADVIDSTTGKVRRIGRSEAAFAYRSSFFKEHRELIIVRVALRLAKFARVNVGYPDLAQALASGMPLTTPLEVARTVRAIRTTKLPSLAEEGTAGSFFKNPLLSHERAAALASRFPGLPVFPQAGDCTKVSLAWILDHVLALKGHARGRVRLYEKQPLIMVAERDATSAEVDALASEVHDRVCEATSITIEREVETFGR